MSLARPELSDLCAARAALSNGQTSARECLAANLVAADSPACRAAYLRRFDGLAQATAASVDAARAAGAPLPPLAGLAVSVKALFDVAGQPPTGGSASTGPASRSCPTCPTPCSCSASSADSN
mgnify:CR=1 FL=1